MKSRAKLWHEVGQGGENTETPWETQKKVETAAN